MKINAFEKTKVVIVWPCPIYQFSVAYDFHVLLQKSFRKLKLGYNINCVVSVSNQIHFPAYNDIENLFGNPDTYHKWPSFGAIYLAPSIRLAVISKGVEQAEVVAVTVAKSPKFGINLSPRRSVYHARAMMQFLSRPSKIGLICDNRR